MTVCVFLQAVIRFVVDFFKSNFLEEGCGVGALHAHLYHRFPIPLVTPDGFNLTCKLIGKCLSRCSMVVVNIV